ncbi:MAG: GGDEF domain-containing protein [Lachnospiraceae bacterium]|nr:GGDEF domain-containing protein [Lachnospiraceae bacterium]
MDGRAIRRILIMVFCLFIGISMSLVMFYTYKPSQNALGALSSVCMDILCVIVLFILIGSFAFGNYGTKRTTRLFGALLLSTVWALFMDFLNWAFDGALEFGHLTFWFTLLSLCMGSVLSIFFSLYLYSYMEETHNLTKMRKSAIACAGLNFVSFIVTFVLAITGTAFTFVDGHYEIGTLYTVVEVIPIVSLLYLTVYTICHIKTVGVHDALAAAGYILFMIAGALIEEGYGIGTTYVAVTLADLFIFVMLQNEVISKEKRNAEEWMKRSNTDELTGLLNRYAYETDFKLIAGNLIDEDFVYVSVDVNSLKVVNDNLGHNAGDEMLIGAADCLRRCFGAYGKLYRIGGDEFIALINADDDELKKVQKNIDIITNAWKGKQVEKLVLSCGYVTRKEAMDLSLKDMAILADKRMYEAKNEYYISHGIERRKK